MEEEIKAIETLVEVFSRDEWKNLSQESKNRVLEYVSDRFKLKIRTLELRNSPYNIPIWGNPSPPPKLIETRPVRNPFEITMET